MDLILISNQIKEIELAMQFGISTVLIDLEQSTKMARQNGRGLYISDHTIEDLGIIRQTFPHLNIITRINSKHEYSEKEINDVVGFGTDSIMIPYFQTVDDLGYFFEMIGNRVDIIPLFETANSIERFGDFIQKFDIKTCHFGLNDLSIEMQWDSIFEAFIWNPLLEALKLAQSHQIKYGIAGIGNQLDSALPVHPQDFFIRQVELGGRVFWLSRNFRKIFQMTNADVILQKNMEILKELYHTRTALLSSVFDHSAK